ncbi:MAG: hypothetical protein R3D67_17180 [Hyphomicrobiaceae bacterium]
MPIASISATGEAMQHVTTTVIGTGLAGLCSALALAKQVDRVALVGPP